MDEFVVTNLPSCCSSNPVGGGTALLATPAAEEYPPAQVLAGRRLHACLSHLRVPLQVLSPGRIVMGPLLVDDIVSGVRPCLHETLQLRLPCHNRSLRPTYQQFCESVRK
jgi:hypothetical protein